MRRRLQVTAAIAMALLALAGMPRAWAQGPTVAIKDMVCSLPPDARPETGGVNLRLERVELTNTGSGPVAMGGWRLSNVALPGRPNPDTFEFPAGFTLAAGATVSVRTGVGDDNATDLFWDRTIQAFRADAGDGAALQDASGAFVHSQECSAFAFGCPDVTAQPLVDGSVRLTFGFSDTAPDRWRIYRATQGGLGHVEIATLPGAQTSHLDTTAPKGHVVVYQVIGQSEDSRGQDCDAKAATVTTIPVFPTIGVAAFALLAGVAAFALLRRR